MKKHPFFYDINHTRMYLKNSVIRFRKQPIYITGVLRKVEEIGLRFVFLTRTKEYSIDLTNKALDFSPVPLGYSNTITGIVKIYSRKPIRAWKTGLSNTNLAIATYNLIPQYVPNDTLHSRSLYNTITNKYPTYTEIRERLKKGENRDTIAFHRHFCLRKEGDFIKLYYYKYGISIGFGSFLPILNPAFSFLNEHLKDAFNEK